MASVHDVETYKFENGLTLHVSAGHPAPVAAIQAWVGVGSADEAPSHAGVAHVVEHMVFRNVSHPGGEMNARTSFDHTVFHAVLGKDRIVDAIESFGAALTRPTVEPDALAREKDVILEEIRQGTDNPARSVAQSLFATAFVAHPYRRPVIGSPESVSRLGERDLVEFFRSYYVADNTTLVVAGDVDARDIADAVERRFGAMPSGRPHRRLAPEPAQTAPRAVASLRDVSEAYVAVGFHVPPARHPDVAALDVAAILLGESESARLPRILRDDEQIATTAYAHVHALRDPGLFVLSATSRASDADKITPGLVKQTLALVDDLDADELEKARIAAEASFVRQLETAQGRARTLGWNATVAGDPRFSHVYLDRIRAVRRHDVAQAVKRYLRPENATVAAVLPKHRATAKRSAVFARGAEKRVRTALGGQAATTQIAEKRVTLGNGMVVIARRDPSVPVVAMRAVWRGGQRVETDAEAGASALLARMITRGCGKLDASAVADRIDRLGGSLGGVAGRNSFGLAAEWLARTWQQGFDLTADCLMDPQFAADELRKEQQAIYADQAALEDNPTQVAFRVFSEALYGTHPYHRDALGTDRSIASLDRAKLLAFYQKRYPVSAMTLAIVGDIDLDETIARVTKRFGTASKAGASLPTVAAPVFDGRPAEDREVYRFLDRAQAHLVIGYPGATIDAKDRFALEVLVAVLGGQNGRLFSELRDKRALVYRVSAHSVEGVDPGFVAVYLSCSPEKLDEAVGAVREQLATITKDGITADELEKAKTYLVGSHQIAMQRRSAVANAIAYHEAYGLGWASWSQYDDAIKAVTLADVAAAAQTYLIPERAITATVRPPVKTPAAEKKSRFIGTPKKKK
ncbi:MAG: pitrilysin family protein [Kofleriaceae bacterium]